MGGWWSVMASCWSYVKCNAVQYNATANASLTSGLHPGVLVAANHTHILAVGACRATRIEGQGKVAVRSRAAAWERHNA